MSELEEKKKRKKRKKAGSESSKESSLRDWFKRKGAKGKKGGWVDCNAPDGKGGYKSCGRSKGEKRKKYPACRPTPGACKERGKGKSWGKKGSKKRGRKKRNEAMEISTEELRTIILEELETVLDEKRKKRKKRKKKKVRRKGKRDACYHKVKARYDVWPSAYASGALTKCRKVGAANWGNKSKKNESLNESEDNFKPHMMYDPKSNKSEMTNKVEDHERLAKKGYTHVDPEKIRKIIGVGEGGAAGMDPFLKEFGKDMKDEIIKTLEAMPDIGKHKNGDYVMADKKEIDVVKEQKKNCGCGQDPCKTYGVQENLVNEIELEEKKKKKKPCKKAKGKRFVRRVNGRCRSFGQAGKAKGGGDRIRPGTKKADAYCARSAKIKKCKNPPCANDLSRKKWKCRGSKSERS